jgi:hypothetical protein
MNKANENLLLLANNLKKNDFFSQIEKWKGN